MEGQRERARAGSAFKGGAKALTLTMDSGLESELEASGEATLAGQILHEVERHAERIVETKRIFARHVA